MPPTNEEDWMLCTNLKETKIFDNTEIIKVKVEQYFKTRVDNVEKLIKTGEVIERINKDTEDVDQYLSEDSNNCIVIKSDATENNKCRLTKTTIQSSITNNNINYEQRETNNKLNQWYHHLFLRFSIASCHSHLQIIE